MLTIPDQLAAHPAIDGNAMESVNASRVPSEHPIKDTEPSATLESTAAESTNESK